jgi:tRNA pseudouridine38-40 synthase
MPRYKLTLEYDGGPFCGWQRQSNGPSVQEALEVAIRRLTSSEVQAIGAGRTDTGVHATGQVAHVDLDRAWPLDTLRSALNYHLRPNPVVVLLVEPVGPDFHARFSARVRHYGYRIVTRAAPLALDVGRAWYVPGRLDPELMYEATRCLIGRHDFTSFRGAGCQAASPVKTLDHLAVRISGDELVVSARARSYLYHQVRNLVGTLKLVGEGKWPVEAVERALRARDRAAAGPTAPAHGLYLTRVDY